ncbi:hypothetical protein HR060_02960 [Catenovulum sp. SM1970]|uniref:hypothetical protein n=1 Tax=Marinifaba aquimaris TaxID=2741323 RepID=UPI0015734CC4|nr:hypothetical protein [Marinifaba aquimaris]NTS75816.1 hypothetical protein [Marinifaba aquimaris]
MEQANSSFNLQATYRYLLVFLSLCFVMVFIRTAWISDDAAITFRSVLNFVHGYGAVYNVGERAQAYTHPLWFMIVSAVTWLIGNVFYAAYIVAFTCLAAAMYIWAKKVAKSTEWLLIGFVTLLFSKSFTDYATSGLENPLSALLVATFIWQAFSCQDAIKQYFRLALLTGLMFLTRPDLILVALPLLAYKAFQLRQPISVIKWSLLAGIPVFTWILISLFYYGFPLPNTAYAKLGMGIAGGELAMQGFQYYLDSINRDPLTLIVIAFALVTTFMSKQTISRLIALGVALYLLYIIKIGGDFMSGRFFAVPLFTCCILLSLQGRLPVAATGVFAAAAASIGFASPSTPIMSDSSYHNVEIAKSGIADERGFYYQKYGLLSGDRQRYLDLPEWRLSNPEKGPTYVKSTCGQLGYKGMYAGPDLHNIDICALADPLLARMPAKYKKKWRIGHYMRPVPKGYQQAVFEGSEKLADENLGEFYQHLSVITKGDLWSGQRFKTILAMNFGQYNDLVDFEYYRTGPRQQAELGQLAVIKNNGARWNELGNVILEERKPLSIALPSAPTQVRQIDLSLDNNDVYGVSLWQNDEKLWERKIHPDRKKRHGLKRHYLGLPKNIPLERVNTIKIEVLEGDGAQSLGHLVLN